MSEPNGNQTVLALNCGSSSLKFALFRSDADVAEPVVDGEAEAIGTPNSRLSMTVAGRSAPVETGGVASHEDAVARLFAMLARNGIAAPGAIGHRIVHGGPLVREHCLIDASVLEALKAAQVFAPLHAPTALAVLRATQAHFPDRPNVACLDTAFHRHMPEIARHFALPAALREKGIERYGFHGLSCESIVRQLGGAAPERLVIAHLGGGSSVTAVKAGQSIDTSMGLTPTGGVMMTTRTGDLDPGLLIYLMRELDMNADKLETLVDREAGMAGVSGLSGDMRQLREASENTEARLAIAMFGYSVRKQIAAMTAALGGIDLLVFTGGIGEHDAETRAEICAGLSWLGIAEAEARSAGACPVRVLPAKEDEQIARHTIAVTKLRLSASHR
jgi:acetate kinase